MATTKPRLKDATEESPSRKSVFVISPIGSPGSEKHRKAKLALEFIIQKALPADAWEVTRGDGSLSPDSIGHDIIKRIDDADLIVADLTDQNPNVFYELAIAHGWAKPTIHIMTRGQDIPFDISDLRTIEYDLTDPESVDKTISSIAGMAQRVFEEDYRAITPMTQYRAFENASSSLSPEAAQTVVMKEILARLSDLETTLRSPRPTRKERLSNPPIIYDEFQRSLPREVRSFIAASRKLNDLLSNGAIDSPEFRELSADLITVWEMMGSENHVLTRKALSSMNIDFPPIDTSYKG